MLAVPRDDRVLRSLHVGELVGVEREADRVRHHSVALAKGVALADVLRRFDVPRDDPAVARVRQPRELFDELRDARLFGRRLLAPQQQRRLDALALLLCDGAPRDHGAVVVLRELQAVGGPRQHRGQRVPRDVGCERAHLAELVVVQHQLALRIAMVHIGREVRLVGEGLVHGTSHARHRMLQSILRRVRLLLVVGRVALFLQKVGVCVREVRLVLEHLHGDVRAVRLCAVGSGDEELLVHVGATAGGRGAVLGVLTAHRQSDAADVRGRHVGDGDNWGRRRSVPPVLAVVHFVLLFDLRQLVGELTQHLRLRACELRADGFLLGHHTEPLLPQPVGEEDDLHEVGGEEALLSAQAAHERFDLGQESASIEEVVGCLPGVVEELVALLRRMSGGLRHALAEAAPCPGGGAGGAGRRRVRNERGAGHGAPSSRQMSFA